MYLFIMIANLPHGTILAFRGAGGAYLPPEMDDAVAEIRLLRNGNHRGKDPLHPEGILQLLGIEADPAADADAVGIRHDAAFFIDITEKQIGDLPAHAGQGQQILHGIRHAPLIGGEKHGGGFLQAFRLGAKQSAGAEGEHWP